MADLTPEQLRQAQKALERQIDILRCPAGGPDWHNRPPDNRQLIAELERELAAVNARLGLGNSAGPKPGK